MNPDPEQQHLEELKKKVKLALAQLNKIIDEEIKNALLKGKTTLEAVDRKVKARSSMLLEQLGTLLAERYRRLMIRRKLKKTEVCPEKAAATAAQMEFAKMEEFRGIPPTITFMGEAGNVEYIPYLDTREFERAAALQLLARSIAADQQTYLAMKSGNEFATKLVAKYGDKPLWDLYRLYARDQKRKQA